MKNLINLFLSLFIILTGLIGLALSLADHTFFPVLFPASAFLLVAGLWFVCEWVRYADYK